jgi:hypothetical protein
MFVPGTLVVFVFLQWSFPFVPKKKKKKEVDITILHLTKLLKTSKKGRFFELNSWTNWIYEPTFGKG